MFWLRNKNNNFQLLTLIWEPDQLNLRNKLHLDFISPLNIQMRFIP